MQITSRKIAAGDVVIIYERFDSINFQIMTQDGEYATRWGKFSLNDWIGLQYGSKVQSQKGGYLYLLAPTPELWTLVLKHRTQILYLADISTVCMQLELRPGAIVLESGTGCGSLTTSMARAVGSLGHIYTFEFHELRASLVAKEFEQNGLSNIITVTQRDIEAEGFPEEYSGKADAVFLDLPGPWKVLPSAIASLKENGIFCSFSPCIEQVQKTCEGLNQQGCMDIRTLEVLLREFEVAASRQTMDLGLANTIKTDVAGPPEKRPKQQQDGAQTQENGNEGIKSTGFGSVVCRPCAGGRGHTGYLTFARQPAKCQ